MNSHNASRKLPLSGEGLTRCDTPGRVWGSWVPSNGSNTVAHQRLRVLLGAVSSLLTASDYVALRGAISLSTRGHAACGRNHQIEERWMAKFKNGEKVVAVKEIGGIWREHVPAGSVGIVTQSGWGQDLRVMFTVKGGIFSDDKKVEVKVESHEIQ